MLRDASKVLSVRGEFFVVHANLVFGPRANELLRVVFRFRILDQTVSAVKNRNASFVFVQDHIRNLAELTLLCVVTL